MNSRRQFRILFVCTGNICRSPMAEGILRENLDPRALVHASVASAGTGAATDLPATDHSVTACAEAGIDISSHRSQPLTREAIRTADLILGMEPHHCLAVARAVPDHHDHVHLLSDYAGNEPGGGVSDPYGDTLERYRQTFSQIHDQVMRALPRIEKEILASVVES